MAAATDVHVSGPALVRVASPASGSLVDFGYSRNGVDITFRSYTEGIPSDLMGGELGPPLDVQYFGETADITCRLTSWLTTTFALVQAVVAGATAGTPAAPGTIFFGDAKDFRMRITSTSPISGTGSNPATNEPYNFPRVLFQQPREINKGTRFSELMVVATAYENASGVLYNEAS